MREIEGYRETLEDILTFTDGRRQLTISDVSRYLGCSRKTAKSKYSFDADGKTIATKLARELLR